MKKQILLLLSFGFLSCFGQDTIRFKTNESRAVKVQEIGIDEVKYHRFDNLQGPQYIANKSEIFYIRYQNGHIDTFKVAAKPAVEQSSATANMSSTPLISIKGHKLVYGGRGLGESKFLRLINNYPFERTKSIMLADYKQYKKFKRNQYISGFIGLGVGVLSPYIGYIITMVNYDYTSYGSQDWTPFLGGLAVGATVGITGGIISSINKHKRYNQKVKIAKMYNEMK